MRPWAGRLAVCAVCAMCAAAPAQADWAAFEMRAPTGPVAAVEAVDSWFTTLATLIFDAVALPPGAYAVTLLAQADCERAGAGGVYRRDGDPADAPTGALGEIAVAADGTATRTLTIKPPRLDAGAEKLTVTEMRGHALVFRAADGVAACGVIPAAPPE